MRVAEAIELDEQTERGLRTLSKGRRVEARVQQRASVILLAAQGWQNKAIADAVKLDRRQVALWRRRFIEGGLQALLQDAARSGRTPSVTLAVESLILSRTLDEQPAAAAQWSTRTLAAHLGLSPTTIRRVWQRNGITPHLRATFNDAARRPRFEDRRIDVVGLYLHPPDRALVLSYDDKSRSPALQRIPPGQPGSPAQAGTMTLDLAGQGMPALFAALHALDGALSSTRQHSHRHEALLRFLQRVHRQMPPQRQLHLIVDHHAGHAHPKVQAWLGRHERMVVHVTPAGVAWFNMVKRFFRGIAEHRIGSDSFNHVAELQRVMSQHLKALQTCPAPVTWTPSRDGADRLPPGLVPARAE